jgi:hypothetical protein
MDIWLRDEGMGLLVFGRVEMADGVWDRVGLLYISRLEPVDIFLHVG